jgi:hypothetical protein
MRAFVCCLGALSLVISACSGPVTVTRQGGTAAWTCPSEPELPTRTDGGFSPVGKVSVELGSGVTVQVGHGRGISTEDLAAITDYVTALRVALRSCRATVNEINQLGLGPVK